MIMYKNLFYNITADKKGYEIFELTPALNYKVVIFSCKSNFQEFTHEDVKNEIDRILLNAAN